MLSFKRYIKESAEKFKAWRDHTRSFNPPNRNIVGKRNKEQYTISVEKASPGSLYYKVHHPKDGEIGNFYVRTNGLDKISVMNATVDEKHQRQGIAAHVYRTIDQDSAHTGMSLVPQNYHTIETSDDAKALWRHLKPDVYESLTEANHGQLTFYDDNAPPPDDKVAVTPEKVHKWVRKHQSNMYIIQHLQKHTPDDKPNTKIHYTNQMAIATRKRDYWLNAKIPNSGGAHYYDRSKLPEDTLSARRIAHGTLTELGYTDLPVLPKIESDSKIDSLPKTSDGRIQFGTQQTAPAKKPDSVLQQYDVKPKNVDKPRIQFGVTKK